MKTKILIALSLALTPLVAMAAPKQPAAHIRSQMYHDRSPKAHVRQSSPHHA
jgi:hypothetical protein